MKDEYEEFNKKAVQTALNELAKTRQEIRKKIEKLADKYDYDLANWGWETVLNFTWKESFDTQYSIKVIDSSKAIWEEKSEEP